MGNIRTQEGHIAAAPGVATRKRGRYRRSDGGAGKGNRVRDKARKAKKSKNEGREKGGKRERRTPDGDSNMTARLT